MRCCTVLLTAAIKPAAGMQMSLVDENAREQEYIDSVEFHSKALAACGLQRRMILVEGSDATAEALQAACAEYGVEFMRQRYSANGGERGKGHREATMIQDTINILAARDGLFLKITGRLRVLNICNIIQAIELSDAACLATPDAQTHYSDTRVISFTGRFWNHVTSLSEYINDDKGHYLEHVVAAAIRVAALDGLRCDYLDPPARIIGRSGTNGEQYSGSFVTNKLNKVKTKLKKKLFPLARV